MNRDSIKARLRISEGIIPHMYKCTGDEVTIGIGHAIKDASTAATLRFTLNGAPASAQQIHADFEKIAAMPKGPVASSFAHLTTVRMSPADMEALLDADIARFEDGLRNIVPTWDSLPACVQEALFDMGFNLGLNGLQKFHNLLAAVAARDWEKAAAECHRKGIN